MADRIGAHHDRHFTERALADAYRRITRLFARYEVPATFAFVLAFTLTESERATLADRLVDVPIDGRNWLRHYRRAQVEGRLDGWHCPDALEMVREDRRHEIACHGFSHAPLAEGSIARADAVREIESCRIAAAIKRIDPRTFVYPRNQIGHLADLAAAGFDGYRTRPPGHGSGIGRRLQSLAAEFDLSTRSQLPERSEGGMVPIPSGYFLNWQRGLRRVVPRRVSHMRWKAILADAARSGNVAHIWLHPHNIIDGPGTIERLEDVVAEAARLRDAGRLQIVTQDAYCRAIRTSEALP